jgi:hypothetical protein
MAVGTKCSCKQSHNYNLMSSKTLSEIMCMCVCDDNGNDNSTISALEVINTACKQEF